MEEEVFEEDFTNPDTELIEPDNEPASDESVSDPSNDGNFQQMQDRMSGDIEPWYSESVKKVVDQDGNDILDKDGKPFRSMDDYEKSLKPPEKPETKTEGQKPITSFMNSEVTIDTLNERVEAGKGFTYKDELLPKIEEVKPSGKVPEMANLDPVSKLKAMQKTWTGIAVQPLKEVAGAMVNSLVQNGANQFIASNIVNTVLNPIIQKQSDAIDTLYKEEYEKAVYQQLEGKVNGKIGEADAAKMNTSSEKNVDDLSKVYFPKYGKAALYELLNGYHTKQGDPSSFTRGQAAHIMDLFTSIYKGDKFSSNQELGKAINDTFLMLTSDKNKASALFDLIHYYSIGKNFATVKGATYQQGKQAAKQEEQRIKKTVRQRPTSKRPPQASMEGLPRAIRSVLMSEA